jgi:hypothetical protein
MERYGTRDAFGGRTFRRPATRADMKAAMSCGCGRFDSRTPCTLHRLAYVIKPEAFSISGEVVAMESKLRSNGWRFRFAAPTIFAASIAFALLADAKPQAPAAQSQQQGQAQSGGQGRPGNRPGRPGQRETACAANARKTRPTHDSTGSRPATKSGKADRWSTGPTRIQTTAPWTWTSAGPTVASVCMETRRPRSHVSLLSAEFWLHQSRAKAGVRCGRIHSIWRSRLFPAAATGIARLRAASAAGLRAGIFRRLRRGVRPRLLHRSKCDGLVGLKSPASAIGRRLISPPVLPAARNTA